MTTMLEIRSSRAARGLALPLLAGAVLGLTACGGGDDGTTTNAANGTAQRGGGQAGYGQAGGGPGFGGRTAEEREELQACLEKQGVTLPSRRAGGSGGGTRTDGAPSAGADGAGTTPDGVGAPPAGADGGPPQGGGLPGGGAAGGRGPGSGMGGMSTEEREELQEALKSCGVTAPAGGRRQGGGAPDVDDPGYRRSIEAYTACVRKNGFDLPDPDFSGDGPVFDPDEVDQTDATFRKASAACRSTLRGSRSGDGARQGAESGTGQRSGSDT